VSAGLAGDPGTVAAADAAARARRWELPAPPGGEAGAARALAATYASVAADVRATTAAARAAVPAGWHGQGARAGLAALERGSDLADRLARGLEEAAGALAEYARRAEAAAHEHHHWWQQVAVVGAVVAVTAGLVVVTVASGGTAAPGAAAAEAAALDAGAAALAAAAESATAAETVLAGSGARALLAALRPLAAFVRPQLATAEVFAGLDASLQEITLGRIDPVAVATGFLADVALPPTVARAAAARQVLRVRGAPHVVVGLGLAGGEAGREIVGQGRVDPLAVLGAGALGAGVAPLATGVRRHERTVLRQSRERVARLRLTRVPLRDGMVPVGWRPAPGETYVLPPGDVRYSQKSVSTGAFTTAQLSVGWKGSPVDVVVAPDGRLTSLDNRRVLACGRNSLSVQARIHLPEEPLPFELRGRFLYRRDTPETWGGALTNRIAKQGGLWMLLYPHGHTIVGSAT